MTEIIGYDGINSIGGNKIVLRDRNTTLLLDFGLNIGAQSQYYEEFITPRESALGLYDRLQLGLLPPIRGIYRPDLSAAAFPYESVLTDDIGEVSGVFLSHAHADHLQDIGVLRHEIPIYCSSMSAAISKAVQDAKGSSEAFYLRLRAAGENGGLKAIRADGKDIHTIFRRHCLVDSMREAGSEFWRNVPLSRFNQETAKYQAVGPAPDRVGGINWRAFPVDHSILGACAYAFETEAGWVVYTGDLRFHGGRRERSHRFIEQAAALKPVALITEGTRIQEPKQRFTEEDVLDSALKLSSQAVGRLVIADFSMRHLERLISMMHVAKEANRRFVIMPEDAYLISAAHEGAELADDRINLPSLDDPNLLLYEKFSSASPKTWDRALRDEVGDDRRVNASQIAEDPGLYLLCIGFFQVNELPFLVKPGAAGPYWIISNSEPYNEEMELDLDRLRNWTKAFQCMLLPYDLQGSDSDADRLHVSGHSSGEEIIEMVRQINPKVVIPIHTTHPEVFRERLAEMDIIFPEKGKPIRL